MDKHKKFHKELYKATDASKAIEAIGNKNQAEKRIVNMQASTEFGVKTEPLQYTVEPDID